VEGYTDVISLVQAGVKNVVASSGTALTSDQIRLINRLTPNITVLFDGDAAGIRASIRGIDLTLEQGLNVKVVAFPEGDDPDSFSKNKSHDEIINYLKENAKDFIQFKTSLLLEETKNDPIKKAELIRSIVFSISKIPNNIQREVYIQECALLMGISEEVLFNELSQNRKKEQRDSARDQKTLKSSFTGVKKETKAIETVDQLFALEKKLIEILLLYGNEEVDFEDYSNTVDEDGKKIMQKNTYTSLVSNEIYIHLQDDEIEFTNPIFLKIYNEIIHYLNQDQKINIETFTNHRNIEIGAAVTNILMDEDKHVLSDWGRKDIIVEGKDKHLSKLVMDVIYNLRRYLIEQKIASLVKDMGPSNSNIEFPEDTRQSNLEMVVNYTALKKLLFERLNRVL
jgi:DNA primase